MPNNKIIIDPSFLDISNLNSHGITGIITPEGVIFDTVLEAQIAVDLSLNHNFAESLNNTLN